MQQTCHQFLCCSSFIEVSLKALNAIQELTITDSTRICCGREQEINSSDNSLFQQSKAWGTVNLLGI